MGQVIKKTFGNMKHLNLISPGPPQEKKKSDKRLSVERIYQKKSQLEHILLRPDTYIGSVQVISHYLTVNQHI